LKPSKVKRGILPVGRPSNQMKGVVPQGHFLLRDNIVKKDNLFGLPKKEKAKWAKGLGLPSRGERILFAGCGYQYMAYAETLLESVRNVESKGVDVDRAVSFVRTFQKVGLNLAGLMAKLPLRKGEDSYTPVLLDAVQVLRKLGVNFAYLGEEEPCCGSPIYYSGFLKDFSRKAEETYGQLKSLGVREVIGLVPACTNTLKNVYPKYIEDYDLKVEYFLEFVARVLREKKVKLRFDGEITVHDPCQVARYLELSHVLREILGKIEGLKVREVATSMEATACCGGGGGMELTYPELSLKVAVNRVKELASTGVDTIVTCCPGCMLQLREGAKILGLNLKVVDAVQLLNAALVGEA